MNAAQIGKRLSDLRGGDNAENLAKALGISVSALRMYESGKRIPRDEIKIRIAKHYGTSVESIFYDNKCHDK